MNRPMDFLRLMRPHDWVKSTFVFAGVLFGHRWKDFPVVSQAVIAAVAFSCISSGAYIVNDLADREGDRLHPSKKHRPLAAGTVSASTAITLGLILWAIGLGLGLWMSGLVTLFLAMYVILSLAYSFGLKQIVILDVFTIAAGFMLRILAGTVGVSIPPSRWLLLCGLMVTLFLGFAKRRAEVILPPDERIGHRAVLGEYTPRFLDMMIGISAACVIVSYSLYTVSPDTIRTHRTNDLIYTVPFVVYGIFRYIYLIHHRDGGGDPSRELLRDPHLLVTMAGWLAGTLWLIL